MTNKNYFQISTGEKNFEKVVSATRGNVYICSIVEAALKRTEDFGRVPVHGISWNTAVIPIPRIELANKELVICAIQITNGDSDGSSRRELPAEIRRSSVQPESYLDLFVC